MFWGDEYDNRFWVFQDNELSVTMHDGFIAINTDDIENGAIDKPGFRNMLKSAARTQRRLFAVRELRDPALGGYGYQSPYMFKLRYGLIDDDYQILDDDSIGYLTIEFLHTEYTEKHHPGKSTFWRLIDYDWHLKLVEEAKEEGYKHLEEIVQDQVRVGVTRGVARAIDEQTATLKQIQDERQSIENQIKALQREQQRLEALEAKAQEKARAKAEAQANQVYDPSGYVYVLKEVNGTHYKIGRTVNPNNRVKTFNVKLPFKVEYEVLIKSDDMYKLERELHNCYASKRVDGEWFALDEADLTELRALTND